MYNVCVDGREITHWKGTLLVANRLDALRVFSGATSSELVKRGGNIQPTLATTRTQHSLSLPDKGFLTFRIHLAVTYQFHRNDCYLVSQTENVFFTKKSKAPDSSPYSSQRKMLARLGGNYRIFFFGQYRFGPCDYFKYCTVEKQQFRGGLLHFFFLLA
jgi:hypothetical protein